MRAVPQLVLVLILAEITAAVVFNYSKEEFDTDINVLREVETRRQAKARKPAHSTSSESGKKGGSKPGNSGESLDVQFTEESSSDTDERARVKKDRKPKSTEERKGWRKWHRKCTPCPSDMRRKWRDPNIKWICGAYQRARRSFKSNCMMYYRNCQDGTMFTKVADHRCPNASGQVRPYGDHFFYDYKVVLSDETSDSVIHSTSSETSASSSWDSSRVRKLPPIEPA